MDKLKFSKNNSKMKKLKAATGKVVYAFDLPAGWSCPAANICLSKAHKVTGKITDGSDTQFRCYAATLEAVFPAARSLRWHNFDLLRGTSDILELLTTSLPADSEIIRVHSSGDFFNEDYLKAWLELAYQNPKKIFYGYTKRADLLTGIAKVPKNFRFAISHGGKFDHLISHLELPVAYVTDSYDGWDIPVFDTDEKSEIYLMEGRGSFALMIHGTQPKGWNGLPSPSSYQKTG